jgi:hypothetical protein
VGSRRRGIIRLVVFVVRDTFLLLLVLLAGTARIQAVEVPPSLGPANKKPISREITTAEREAAQLVLRYFERGAPALVEALSAKSPLRDLPGGTPALEVVARAGPASGSRWRLVTTAASGPTTC